MAEMIETYYKTSEYVLPPYVELEEALSILVYYGLPVHHPKDIKLGDTDLQTRLRAKFFLKHYEGHKSAIKAIIQEFETNPHYEKSFLFLPEKYEPSSSPVVPRNTVAVGSEIPFERHENKARFMEDLIAEGFEAGWNGNLTEALFREKGSKSGTFKTSVFSVFVKVPLADPVEKRQAAT